MKIAFRADASVEIGAGHVMRCLTLADVLLSRGVETVFLCRKVDGHLGDLIRARGHGLDWLPDTGTDADGSAAALAPGAPWDYLVVDHYGLSADWERAQRSLVKRILAIDDVANRAHDCDLLLDQNLQEAGRYDGLVPADGRLLIGPRFALLRPQFAAARGAIRVGQVRRLLVFFGGVDAGGETLKALAALELLARGDLVVDVVIGQSNPHHAAIAQACGRLPGAVLHRQVEDMAAQMAAADLFLGAAGASSWERCCLGLPALVLATADNQIDQSTALAQAGAQAYLGPAATVTAEHLARALASLIELPELLIHMARQGAALVDGRGATRVANRLLAVAVEIRRAQPGDCDYVFAWRNHPETRRYSLDSAEIDWQTHSDWFARVLADPERELLIAEEDGRPVGVLRYDLEAGCARISIYLQPGLGGRGLGVRLLLAAEAWLCRERGDVQALEAEIRVDNMASMAAFQAAGFSSMRTLLRKELRDRS